MKYTKTKILAMCCFCVILTLIYVSVQDPIFHRQNASFRGIRFSARLPLCHNLLTNLTDGKWIKRIDLSDSEVEYQRLIVQERELDRILTEYRINRGIHTRLWRDDNKCGYKNLQEKPSKNAWGGPVGAWCDAKSLKPCCNDEFDGVCGNVCNCTNCIDMRNIIHAEISEWIPSDARCRPRNYTSFQACEVLRNIEEIHFVGDSFVRKLLRALVLLLRSDPVFGALAKHYNEEQRKICTGINQFFWSDCNFPGGNFPNLLVNKSSFCGQQSPNMKYSVFYNNMYAGKFLELVKGLSGKQNTVVFLEVGYHDGCDAQLTQNRYLDPALKHLTEHSKTAHLDFNLRWPHIVYIVPDTPGLMKSLKHYRNGKTRCDIFSSEMKSYCNKNNISVLDFSKLTSGVHSYDGAHHGIGVNFVKVQIMLNYLDSIFNHKS